MCLAARMQQWMLCHGTTLSYFTPNPTDTILALLVQMLLDHSLNWTSPCGRTLLRDCLSKAWPRHPLGLVSPPSPSCIRVGGLSVCGISGATGLKATVNRRLPLSSTAPAGGSRLNPYAQEPVATPAVPAKGGTEVTTRSP